MSDAGHEPVEVQAPRKDRWLRRELWFAVAAVLAVILVFLAVRHRPASHTAPGRPYGRVPTQGGVVVLPRPIAPAA